MIIFNNIAFRTIEKTDLEEIRQEHNRESTLLNLGDPSLVTELQQNSWWESISRNKNNTVFGIVQLKTNKLIGVWRLQNLDTINRTVEVGIDIFEKYQGKGYGKMGYQMIFKYLFENYNIHTIFLRVGEFNAKAISLYKKVGFKETGKITESIYRHGKYWDNIIMCITSNDYFSSQKVKAK